MARVSSFSDGRLRSARGARASQAQASAGAPGGPRAAGPVLESSASLRPHPPPGTLRVRGYQPQRVRPSDHGRQSPVGSVLPGAPLGRSHGRNADSLDRGPPPLRAPNRFPGSGQRDVRAGRNRDDVRVLSARVSPLDPLESAAALPGRSGWSYGSVIRNSRFVVRAFRLEFLKSSEPQRTRRFQGVSRLASVISGLPKTWSGPVRFAIRYSGLRSMPYFCNL